MPNRRQRDRERAIEEHLGSVRRCARATVTAGWYKRRRVRMWLKGRGESEHIALMVKGNAKRTYIERRHAGSGHDDRHILECRRRSRHRVCFLSVSLTSLLRVLVGFCFWFLDSEKGLWNVDSEAWQRGREFSLCFSACNALCAVAGPCRIDGKECQDLCENAQVVSYGIWTRGDNEAT